MKKSLLNGSESKSLRNHFESDSRTSRKLFALLALVMCFGVGEMWGETAKLIWSSGTTAGSNYYFQATSGSITDVLSFECTKNSSSTNPAYNSNNSQLRLYYNSNKADGKGNYITITAAEGVTFTAFTIKSATTPTTKYSVDGGSLTDISVTANTEASVTNLSCSSIRIQNCNTTSTQLQIKYIIITYTPPTIYSVSWSVNGESCSGSPTTSVTSGGKVSTLPTDPTSSDCDGDKDYVGWTASPISGTTNTKPSDLFTAASEAPTVTDDVTYYAVFANEASAGGTSATLFNITDYSSTPDNWTNNGVATGSYFLFNDQNDALTSPLLDPHNNVNVSCNVATYGSGDNNNLTVQLLDENGTVKDTKTTTTPTSSSYVSGGTLSFGKITYPFKIKFIRTASSGRGVRLQVPKCTAKTLPTYNAYRTSCCDPLGTINGDVTLGQLATPDPTKLKATWSMNATTGIASYDLEVYNSSDVKVKTINDYTSGDEITGLTPCTTYYVKLYTVSSGGDYCDGGLIGTSSTCTTNGYSVNYSGCSNVSQSGATSVCGSEALSVTFSPSSVAYVLPDNVSVTIGGNAATVVTDYTWTKATGVLSIPAAKQTGNIVIDVDGVFVGCSADPTVTNENLQLDGSGTFSLAQVDVKTSGWSVGSNTCEWTDYGFVWGTSANPTVGGSGCTQVQVGTSGNATSWSGSLEGDFETGTTYYYRAYAKNSKSEAAYVYSSSDGTFTPYTISFNKNNKDATGTVATQVVNGGSSITLPSASAYELGCNDLTKWALNSASGTQYDPEDTYNSISADAEFYAVWEVRTYTVSYAAGNTPPNGGTITGSHDDDTKTCGVKFTLPGVTFYSTGYTQDGWSKADGGTKTNNLGGTYNPSEANEKDQTFYPHWLINTYTISKGTATGCLGDDFTLSATSVDHYGSITVTASADATHKGDPTVTISPSGNGSVSGTTISNITGDIEVSVSFAAKEAATVTLSILGSESEVVSDALEGDSYTLPSTASGCLEMGLYGWYTSSYSHATTAPSGDNFKSKGQTVTLEAGENKFYAVYATVEEDAADTYTKITSTSELVTGDYLIVAYYNSSFIEAMKNTVNASDYMDEVNVYGKVDNKTTPTKVTLDSDNPAIRWKITKSTNTVTIYNAAVTKYFCGSTGTPALNTTSEDFSYSVDGGDWTLVTNSNTIYYSNQWYVGTPSSAKPIYLFKRDAIVGGPYTTSPTCVAYDLTYTDPGDEGTVVIGKESMGEGRTTTATATPSDHYTFSYWTISGTGSTMSNTSEGKSTDNPVTITMGSEDTEITAHFTEKEKCTVVFKNNNGVVSSTTYWLSEVPEAPTLKDGTTDGGKAFVGTSETHYGWTHTAWENTLTQDQVNAKTADNVKVYAKDATLPAITAGDDGTTITYHAVWAHESIVEGDDGTLTINYTKAGTSYVSDDRTIDGITLKATNKWGGQSYSTSYYAQIKTDGVVYNSTKLGSYIKSIAITRYGGSGNFYVGTSENPTTNETAVSSTTHNYTKQNNYTYFAISSTSTLQLTSFVVTYATSTTSYSAFRTTGPMTFTAATNDNWNTATNWTGGFVPTIENDVIISKPVTVDNDAKARSVVIDQSSSNTGSITISAGKVLLVAETVKADKGSGSVDTEATDIVVESNSSAGNGALVMGENDGKTKATVKFYTKAGTKTVEGKQQWVNQYIGTPFNDEDYVKNNYIGTQLYEFCPAQNGTWGGTNTWWNRLADNGSMDAFIGYNLLTTQAAGSVTLTMKGTLVAGEDQEIDLAYGSASRDNRENLLANSWLAPIHIDKFETADFGSAEATIYIFNAGTPEEALTHESDGSASATAAGQYIVLPIASAPWTSPTVTVIPSMQAFSVFSTAASQTLTLNYEKLVYNPAKTDAGIVPNRVKKREGEIAPEVVKLHVSAASGYAANAFVLGREDFTDGFDNGWDGRYMEGDEEAPQLFSLSADGNMSVNCVPEIEGTVLSFKAGSLDKNYTFTFEYNDAEELYLLDTQTNECKPVKSGESYTFSTSDKNVHNRFVLTRYNSPQVATDLEPTPDPSLKGRENGFKFVEDQKIFILYRGVLYDATGKRVEERRAE